MQLLVYNSFRIAIVYETRRKKNDEYVLEGLRNLEEEIASFLYIKERNPELFNHLLLSQEFLKLREKNREAASLNRAFFPEKHLVSFTTAVNQISLIRDAALEVNNVEVARSSTYHLIRTLATACEIPENSELAKIILDNLANFRKAVENNSELAYAASITWYVDVVYKSHFDISYLKLFGDYLTSFIQEIVTRNQANLFQLLISSLADLGNSNLYDEETVSAFGNLLERLDPQVYEQLNRDSGLARQLCRLKDILDNLQSEGQLNNALELLSQIEQVAVPRLQLSAQEAVEKEVKMLERAAKFLFKFNRLTSLIFDAGAYCLFKKRGDYIRYMWNHEQSPGVYARGLGSNIIPETVSGVINFYFNSRFSQGMVVPFWDDNYGSEIYYKQYFLLLLLHELERPHGSYGYQLPRDLDSYGLGRIEYSASDFLSLAKQLKSEPELLRRLDFNPNTLSNIIDNRLIPCLHSLKAKAQEQLVDLVIKQEVSSQKIDQFKGDFYRKFNESVRVRELLVFLNLYEYKLRESVPSSSLSIEIREVIDKAGFFEKWHKDYDSQGANYGSILANLEDAYVLSEIIKVAPKVEIEITAFENVLDALVEDVENFAIFILNSTGKYFRTSRRFTLSWDEEGLESKPKSYIGSYRVRECLIPVFQVFLRQESIDVSLPDESFLLLNKTKLCKLLQFSPNEVVGLGAVEGIYVSIQTFSDNQGLLESLLQEASPWLLEKGSQEEQIGYLKTKVRLHICETLKVDMHNAFQGYLVTVPSSDGHISDFLN